VTASDSASQSVRESASRSVMSERVSQSVSQSAGQPVSESEVHGCGDFLSSVPPHLPSASLLLVSQRLCDDGDYARQLID
jgi:hypothetical protein